MPVALSSDLAWIGSERIPLNLEGIQERGMSCWLDFRFLIFWLTCAFEVDVVTSRSGRSSVLTLGRLSRSFPLVLWLSLQALTPMRDWGLMGSGLLPKLEGLVFLEQGEREHELEIFSELSSTESIFLSNFFPSLAIWFTLSLLKIIKATLRSWRIRWVFFASLSRLNGGTFSSLWALTP